MVAETLRNAELGKGLFVAYGCSSILATVPCVPKACSLWPLLMWTFRFSSITSSYILFSLKYSLLH